MKTGAGGEAAELAGDDEVAQEGLLGQPPEPAFENLPSYRAPPARLRMSPGSAPLWIGQLSGVAGLPKQVSGAKALNPKGLRRQHPSRFCWLAWRGFGGQDHGTRPGVQDMYPLCTLYVPSMCYLLLPRWIGSTSGPPQCVGYPLR